MKKFLASVFLALATLKAAALSATVSWDQNTETNLVGYIVTLATTNTATNYTIAYPSNKFVVPNLAYGTPYSIWVQATNSAGLTSTPSTPIAFTIQPGLQTSLTNGLFTLTFPSGYTLQSSTNLLSWTDVTSTSPYTTPATNPYMLYRLRSGVIVTQAPPPVQVVLNGYQTNNTQTSSNTFTYTAPSNTLFVLTSACETAQNTNTVSSTPALTWTRVAQASAAGSGDAAVWRANATNAGQYKITSVWGGTNRSVSSVLYNFSNAVVGASNVVNSQSLPSITVTTTKTNSIILVASSDWMARSGTITYQNPPVMVTDTHTVTSKYQASHWYINATNAGTYTTGETAPSGQVAGTVVAVVNP